MDNKGEDKRSKFPEGYEYFEEIISPQINIIKDVEEQIARLPKVRSTTMKLEFNPIAMGKLDHSVKFAETRNYLERQLTYLESELSKRITAETRNLDPDDVHKIKEAIVDLRNPSPFEGKTEQQMKYHKPQEKDLNNSQHYSQRLLENSRLKLAQSVNDKTNDSKPEFVEKNETEKYTLGSRVIVSLSYTRMKENQMKKNLEPAKDIMAQSQRSIRGRDMDM
ncbi:hypothetical protein [Arcicella lustrica]|uniref:Uncharacterized protein n=1 Tax=Arcicella lustrica TaxID=2984196 RepID=A0ABU5SGJ6_9BACT|nr:hypothetical protein [Arcicella sp. DC25W]MEA5426386.1 hypothetical protein [Arcicella sp. DC25W]